MSLNALSGGHEAMSSTVHTSTSIHPSHSMSSFIVHLSPFQHFTYFPIPVHPLPSAATDVVSSAFHRQLRFFPLHLLLLQHLLPLLLLLLPLGPGPHPKATHSNDDPSSCLQDFFVVIIIITVVVVIVVVEDTVMRSVITMITIITVTAPGCL